MKDQRIGNDLRVKWTLVIKGTSDPFLLQGKDVSLYLKGMYGKKKLEDFTVSGNTLEWTFFGKNQKHTGVYSLILVVNEGEEGMVTTDACNFVNLVSCSCKTGGSDECGIFTETVELTSTIEYMAGGSVTVDTELSETSLNPLANAAITAELKKKVSAEEGMGLSSNDFTDVLREKLLGLENYNDAEISSAVEKLSRDFETLLGNNASAAIESFNEIIAFLEGIDDSANLDAIVASIQQEIAKVSNRLTELSAEMGRKQDTIADLETIRSGAEKGATAIQEVKTINNQTIVGSGNIEINSGTLTAEEIASTEPTAEFPQVLYTVQELTEEQKSQARENIGVDKAIEDAIAEIPEPESSVFEAIYGETTYEEIVVAYNANKHVIVKYAAELLSLAKIKNDFVEFTALSDNISILVRCFNGGNWVGYTISLEKPANKVTSLSSASTDAQYPSAKAVYDFVQNSITNVLNEEV